MNGTERSDDMLDLIDQKVMMMLIILLCSKNSECVRDKAMMILVTEK